MMGRAMKVSGVEWLEEIPSSWLAFRVHSLFRRKLATSKPDAELLSVYRDYGVVPKSSRDDNFNRAGADLSVYQYVEVGDLVLNKMKTWQGSIAVSNHSGLVSPAYYIAKPWKPMNLRYIHHLLRSQTYIDRFATLSAGVRVNQWDLSYEDFKNVLVLFPPIDEQRRIAAWLDLQTNRIDKRRELLREKRGLLRDLRTNLISETLASGLREQEKVPTGLSDLPEFPVGWTASHAKRLLRFITSGSRGWAEYYADEGDFFLRIGNLTRETIELNLCDVQHVALPSKAAEGKRTRIREGDMLVSITADLGSIAVAPKLAKAAYVNQHIALCRPKDSVHPRWLGYAMLSSQSKRQMMSSGYGGTKVQLSLDDVRNVWLAVPPLDEQQEIAAFLDRKLSQIDRQIALIDQLDALLQQQRKAIIHEAVTGKIDLSEGPVGDKLSPTEVVRPPFMR
jgi:type I restriction enzyme S subunit